MTVLPFKLDDLGCFEPNEYSEPDAMLPLLAGRAGWQAATLWKGEFEVAAIGCYREYWNGCWEGFFLISANFDNISAGRLRVLISQHMTANKATRLQTESVTDETLRSWHKFLGFKLEGTKRKMMFNRDYDCWAIVREGV